MSELHIREHSYRFVEVEGNATIVVPLNVDVPHEWRCVDRRRMA
jgi:hypothetical protein